MALEVTLPHPQPLSRRERGARMVEAERGLVLRPDKIPPAVIRVW